MKHVSGYTTPAQQSAFEAGARAYQRGKPVNPHMPGTTLYFAWHKGWMYQHEIEKGKGGKSDAQV